MNKRLVKDIINSLAEDLNDNLFETWHASQLLRYFNEGTAILASLDPANYVKIVDIILPANQNILPKNCGCRKIYNIHGEVDKYGNLSITPQKTNENIYSGFREPKKQNNHELKNIPINTYTIDKKTNTTTFNPISPFDRKVRVECAYIPEPLTLDEEVDDCHNNHMAIIKQYVLMQAKMMDIVGGASNTEAAFHYKLFVDLTSLLIGADSKFVKTKLTEAQQAQVEQLGG